MCLAVSRPTASAELLLLGLPTGSTVLARRSTPSSKRDPLVTQSMRLFPETFAGYPIWEMPIRRAFAASLSAYATTF